MGLFYTLMFGNHSVGFDFGHSMDLGANYKIPYYSERQYLALGTDLSLQVGSNSWLTIILPFLKGSLYLEVNGVKLVPSWRLLYDITTYDDLCYSLDLYTKGLELVVTASVDILDCSLGAFGTFYELFLYYTKGWPKEFGQAADCDFRSYWFEKRPIYRIGLDNLVKEWWLLSILPEQCLVRQK